MATKLGKMVTYLKQLLPIKLPTLIWLLKPLISTTTVLMTTKLGRVVTYLEAILSL